MIQLPSSKLKQAQSHNEDWGKEERPTSRRQGCKWIHPLSHFLTAYFLSKGRDSQRKMRGRGMTVFKFSPTPHYRFPSLFQNSHRCCLLLVTSPCHSTGIFCFGFTCELLGRQIIYVSHPFLTAHCYDYTMFEFSQLFHVRPPQPHPPSLWAGKCFFCLLIAYKHTLEKIMSTAQLHKKSRASI